MTWYMVRVLSSLSNSNTLRMAMDVNLDVTEAQRSRLNQLNELDERRIAVVDQTTLI